MNSEDIKAARAVINNYRYEYAQIFIEEARPGWHRALDEVGILQADIENWKAAWGAHDRLVHAHSLLVAENERLKVVAEAAAKCWDNSSFIDSDEYGRTDSVDGEYMLAMGDAIDAWRGEK